MNFCVYHFIFILFVGGGGLGLRGTRTFLLIIFSLFFSTCLNHSPGANVNIVPDIRLFCPTLTKPFRNWKVPIHIIIKVETLSLPDKTFAVCNKWSAIIGKNVCKRGGDFNRRYRERSALRCKGPMTAHCGVLSVIVTVQNIFLWQRLKLFLFLTSSWSFYLTVSVSLVVNII